MVDFSKYSKKFNNHTTWDKYFGPKSILKNERGLSISESINEIVSNSNLKNVKPSLGADNFVSIRIGDIHGDLKALLIMLKTANLIDEKGNWNQNAKGKSLVMLGDIIDRGPYSLETYTYLKNLQEQALESSSSVILIVGNHELEIAEGSLELYGPHFSKNDYGFEIEKKVIGGLIYNDIQSGKLQFVHMDKNFKAISCHAGYESLLTKLFVLDQIKHNPKYRKEKNEEKCEFNNRLRKNIDIITCNIHYNSILLDKIGVPRFKSEINPDEKVTGKEIEKWCSDNNVDKMDIINWLNQKCREYVMTSNKQKFSRNDPVHLVPTILTWNRTKITKRKNKLSNEPDNEKYKDNRINKNEPVFFYGHNITMASKDYFEEGDAKVKRINNEVYMDTGNSSFYSKRISGTALSFSVINVDGKIMCYELDKDKKDYLSQPWNIYEIGEEQKMKTSEQIKKEDNKVYDEMLRNLDSFYTHSILRPLPKRNNPVYRELNEPVRPQVMQKIFLEY